MRRAMRFCLTLLAFTILISIAMSGICVYAGIPGDPAPHQVFLYEHSNFEGQRLGFDVGDEVLDLTKWQMSGGKKWNDKISSIKIGRNAKIYVYKHINKQGYLTTYEGDGYDVLFINKLGSFNDVISSFWVVQSRHAR